MNAPFKPPRSRKKKREYLEHVLQRHLDAVDALLAEIDEMDGDWDLEPSNGALEACNQRRWAQGVTDGREEACEDEGAQCEGEGDWDELESDQCGGILTYHPEDQRRVLSAQFGDQVIYTNV